MEDNFADRAREWDNPQKTKMTKIFVAEMLSYIQPQSTWKAMEIGAGTGLVGLQIAHLVNQIVFEDTSEAMLEVLKQKLDENICAELLNGEIFDYKQQDIDLMFSCMAFHHIPDIEKTLNHLTTIAKPGAIVVIGDLASEDGSFHNFEPIPHRGFDTEILAEQFRQAGFEVLNNHVYNMFERELADGKISNFEQFILVAKKK